MTVLHSPEATLDWGRQLAGSLQAGDVIALCGNLGAGKTQAAKGIALGLGSAADVTSPTFTLAHEYTDGHLPLFHFDFYRMKDEAEVLALGWDEFLDEPGVVLVEWADRFPALLPPRTRWFFIESLSADERAVREGARP